MINLGLSAGVDGIGSFFPTTTTHAETNRVTSELNSPNSDVRQLMKLIADTPQDKCVEVMAEQFRKGVPYRIALAALFLRTIEYNDTHVTFATHAAHRMSLDVPEQHRLIPFFWALNLTKTHEEKHSWAKPGHYLPLKEASLSPEQANRRFVEGMADWDSEKAASGLIALARRESHDQTFTRLWPYAARNMGFIGHYAIALANGDRTLRVIGWQYHEQFLRFLVKMMCLKGPAGNLVDGPGPQYEESLARSQQIDSLRPGWRYRIGNRAATIELYNVIRSGKSKDACDLAFTMLKSGNVQAGAIWDAIYLASAEFLMRSFEAKQLGGRPVHANTSSNALDYAFRTCNRADVALLTLLEAVDWITETIAAWTDKKTSDGQPLLRTLKITDFRAKETSASERTIEDIFSELPALERLYLDGGVKTVVSGAPRETQDAAAESAYTLLQSAAGQQAFQRVGRSYVLSKAGPNAHHYKFCIAALENARHISPEWRPNYLAASVHYGFGPLTPDNGILRRATRG